ncbi:ABC transporter ATP-binding protein [Bifidobacterium leontopitheci]|uniref:ABC transporter ATP-binding protein n=1 Tax=Bifidobacterium leontopitheci TaxID=2650774 RepID=A0A6I1GTJ5_9BIFI|nr:ABC transporter ATP-binding protein [Bifidobacterium leontopitheci]KAB7789781.1 ABC transporter ATP-binding protein [Bifidobacterium leontopitheci]
MSGGRGGGREPQTGADSADVTSAVPLVALDHATRAFPGRDGTMLEILHSTTLEIGHGERVAVVGPSGSGKSTLLAILGTLDMPTTGRLLYDGEDVTAMNERQRSMLRASRIGFVFQQFHLIATASALDNVATGLQYTALPRGERRRRALRALEQVGLGERVHHKPSQLSGGEQQRVALARALVKQPDIIFADEPTGALDTATGRAVIDLLLAAAGQGASLVVVTHDLDVAARFPRRLHIQDGVVTELGGGDGGGDAGRAADGGGTGANVGVDIAGNPAGQDGRAGGQTGPANGQTNGQETGSADGQDGYHGKEADHA